MDKIKNIAVKRPTEVSRREGYKQTNFNENIGTLHLAHPRNFVI